MTVDPCGNLIGSYRSKYSDGELNQYAVSTRSGEITETRQMCGIASPHTSGERESNAANAKPDGCEPVEFARCSARDARPRRSDGDGSQAERYQAKVQVSLDPICVLVPKLLLFECRISRSRIKVPGHRSLSQVMQWDCAVADLHFAESCRRTLAAIL